MFDAKAAIAKAVDGQDFTSGEIAEVFGYVMDGEVTPAQIGGLLIALRMKGVVAQEIAGAALAMRARAAPINCPDIDKAVDTCGTGGDRSGSVNISTMAAVVVAAAGGLVAKHGNRALSSRSGSADVLEALGVCIDTPVSVVEKCMRELGIGFLFAPAFHVATRHAALPRKELGVRTIFNLLGPLTNPARARNQVIGVFDAKWCRPVAEALGELGSRHVFVVHGIEGIDEVAVQGLTHVAEYREGRDVQEYEISPGDFGLEESDPRGLTGGDAKFNADFAMRVFQGEPGAGRNAVVMASAMALRAAGQVSDFREGASRALDAIATGRALHTLDAWIRMSQQS